eukprot:CAMPEP_0203931716 /NCGR_PEP_ID=MMETSP0359-20131031/70257_1 /ASSEMBLY_ACC=CAM_ASM_000338 /TAXON_ID=268821 /ORGANISM="Scrippsiella Hangoei, Strain SHTV-5" /LENGTH=385 /DNA_ID=CAMNT_0050861099 /DNA_START=38 /DNA_END=1192 /DNA_ORIENTATION=+
MAAAPAGRRAASLGRPIGLFAGSASLSGLEAYAERGDPYLDMLDSSRMPGSASEEASAHSARTTTAIAERQARLRSFQRQCQRRAAAGQTKARQENQRPFRATAFGISPDSTWTSMIDPQGTPCEGSFYELAARAQVARRAALLSLTGDIVDLQQQASADLSPFEHTGGDSSGSFSQEQYGWPVEGALPTPVARGRPADLLVSPFGSPWAAALGSSSDTAVDQTSLSEGATDPALPSQVLAAPETAPSAKPAAASPPKPKFSPAKRRAGSRGAGPRQRAQSQGAAVAALGDESARYTSGLLSLLLRAYAKRGRPPPTPCACVPCPKCTAPVLGANGDLSHTLEWEAWMRRAAGLASHARNCEFSGDAPSLQRRIIALTRDAAAQW